MWKKFSAYVYWILATLGVGMLAGFLTKDSMAAYEAISKSSLTPPSIVFPIVWSVLYILMGIGAALIFRSDSPDRGTALTVYVLQLAVNFFWSIFFFNLRAYLFSLLWLLLLWLLILTMIVRFYRINRTAALLQIPYLLWVSFAGYLNAAIWVLNR